MQGYWQEPDEASIAGITTADSAAFFNAWRVSTQELFSTSCTYHDVYGASATFKINMLVKSEDVYSRPNYGVGNIPSQ
jgi:hypothetical protein